MSTIDIKRAYSKLTPTEKECITVLHSQLYDIKNAPERYADPVQLIEDMEYTLQGIWKFPRDSKYHTHWLGIKGCTCPKMDNKDPFYFGRGKIIVSDCPWHWHRRLEGIK